MSSWNFVLRWVELGKRFTWLQTLWRFWLRDLYFDEMVGAWCFCCLSGPLGSTCLIYFALVFSFIYCWVLIFALSLFLYWFICSRRYCIDMFGSFMRAWYLCVLVHIWIGGEFGMWNRLWPSSKIFYWSFQGGTSFVDPLCFFSVCVCSTFCASVCVCLVVACWEGLASWLSFVVSICEFITFPLVSWVKCGTWLYHFLIFTPLLTFITLGPGSSMY